MIRKLDISRLDFRLNLVMRWLVCIVRVMCIFMGVEVRSLYFGKSLLWWKGEVLVCVCVVGVGEGEVWRVGKRVVRLCEF